MKVFFTASPRILETHRTELIAIFNEIENSGHTNLSRLVIENDVEAFYNFNAEQRAEHFETTVNHIKSSDIVVMEASIHSLAMGYILEKALSLNKQVILLHMPGKEPFFFTGLTSENLQIIDYTLSNIPAVLSEAFSYATDQQDIRFNLLISPTIANYLSDISRKENVSKAGFVRQLIKQHMKQNRE